MQTDGNSYADSPVTDDSTRGKQRAEGLYDVAPGLYANTIRDLNRHENDVTSHRLIWLLVFQGVIANAYSNAWREGAVMREILPVVGILGAFSAFVMLYKSYQARGYLEFLGGEAKRGNLPEKYLPLSAWPKRRIKDWRKKVWVCPWLGKAGDLLEPYLFLPGLMIGAWLFVVLRQCNLNRGVILILTVVLVVVLFSIFCIAWVWSQSREEQEQLGSAGSEGQTSPPNEA